MTSKSVHKRLAIQQAAKPKERGILFSAPMVLAIRAGLKTQTRRVVKWPAWVPESEQLRLAVGFGKGTTLIGRFDDGRPVQSFGCPYGEPGDRLWVREAWQVADASEADLRFRADGKVARYLDGPEGFWRGKSRDTKWRPSIHLPRWASRLTLEVVSVQVERLHAISEADAKAEGIAELPLQRGASGAWWSGDVTKGSDLHGRTPVAAYRLLWESINGAGSWDANPWAWVVTFKRVEAARG